SSLMNALLGADRSIVTPVPGTTRDTVEESISIHGLPVCLVDTAGVRRARGVVEEHGVLRTAEAIRDADLVLVLVDSSRRWTADDRKIWTECGGKEHLLVLSKSDLARKAKLPDDLGGENGLLVSVVTGAGLAELRSTMEPRLNKMCNTLVGNAIAINCRQESDLKASLLALTQTRQDSACKASVEIVAQGLRTAVQSLDSLTGASATDDVLDRIFARFCIGK
ncbi:GTP-binding protein, partial [bacterium]|nr:GTP-binding protein [bacterium]